MQCLNQLRHCIPTALNEVAQKRITRKEKEFRQNIQIYKYYGNDNSQFLYTTVMPHEETPWMVEIMVQYSP
jgi:hypothetical protein